MRWQNLDQQILDPQSNFINSMEKTNEMINNFQKPNSKNIFGNPQKGGGKKRDEWRDLRSEKSEHNGTHDNSGLNFSNLFNQMDDSNIVPETDNFPAPGNGSFSLDPPPGRNPALLAQNDKLGAHIPTLKQLAKPS